MANGTKGNASNQTGAASAAAPSQPPSKGSAPPPPLKSDVRELRTAGGMMSPSVFAPALNTPVWGSFALAPGDAIGHYRMQAVLGAGRTGTVMRAFSHRLKRQVALKVFSDTSNQLGAEEARAKLLKRAFDGVALNHPNVVRVLDVGEHRSAAFVAMDLADGVPLRRFIGVSVKMSQALRWLDEVARGLHAAHRAGVVHCGIKPTNILVCESGAKVSTFGSAGAMYMAPEHLAGERVDERADQYAWGLIACELLCGVHPRGESYVASAPNTTPHLDDLPIAIAKIIRRALAPTRTDRFASMREISNALAPLLQPAESAEERGPVPSALLDALVAAATKDLRMYVGSAWTSATLSVALVAGDSPTKQKFSVQITAKKAAAALVVVPASASCHAASGIVAANARSGEKRWQKLVLHLSAPGSGSAPRVEVFEVFEVFA